MLLCWSLDKPTYQQIEPSVKQLAGVWLYPQANHHFLFYISLVAIQKQYFRMGLFNRVYEVKNEGGTSI